MTYILWSTESSQQLYFLWICIILGLVHWFDTMSDLMLVVGQFDFINQV